MIGGYGALSPVVKRLLIANVVIHFLQFSSAWFTPTFALTGEGLFSGKLYLLVSYQYLHSMDSIIHILFNMLILFFFGPILEQNWGSRRFFIVYTLAGAVAGLAQILFSSPNTQIVGASGSLMAVFTAFALYYPNQEVLIWFIFPVKVKYIYLFTLFLNIAGVFTPDKIAGGSSIAYWAHLGGVLVGFLYVKFVAPSPYSSRSSWGSSPYSESDSGSVTEKVKDVFESFVGEKKKPNMNYHETEKKEAYDYDLLKFYRGEVDRLLDKINQVGYLNLNDEERKQLEVASDYLKQYDSH